MQNNVKKPGRNRVSSSHQSLLQNQLGGVSNPPILSPKCTNQGAWSSSLVLRFSESVLNQIFVFANHHHPPSITRTSYVILAKQKKSWWTTINQQLIFLFMNMTCFHHEPPLQFRHLWRSRKMPVLPRAAPVNTRHKKYHLRDGGHHYSWSKECVCSASDFNPEKQTRFFFHQTKLMNTHFEHHWCFHVQRKHSLLHLAKIRL